MFLNNTSQKGEPTEDAATLLRINRARFRNDAVGQGEAGQSLRFGLMVLLLGCVVLSGCATNDPEADTFFRRGWLWPKSMDRAEEKPPPTEDSSQYAR